MTLLLLLALLACDDDEPGPNSPMTADRLQYIVVEAHAEFVRHRYNISTREKAPPVTGRCFGDQPAAGSVPTAEVRRSLARFVTGPALQCYWSSYFGCTIGDRVSRAGVARSGPAYGPYEGSKVTVVEQTPTRIVADVTEIDDRLIGSEGVFNPDDHPELASQPLVEKTSRYTLTKNAKGKWLIYDRKPNFEWECRVR